MTPTDAREKTSLIGLLEFLHREDTTHRLQAQPLLIRMIEWVSRRLTQLCNLHGPRLVLFQNILPCSSCGRAGIR
jgi:hypothetical protein